jgi:hypothetical protein
VTLNRQTRAAAPLVSRRVVPLLSAVKPITLLLAGSLLANAALVGFFALRAKPTPSAAVAAKASSLTRAGDGSANLDALRAALASGDAAALEAAGVSPEVARELAIGRTFSRMAEKIRSAQGKGTADGRWWRSRSGFATPAVREQELLARRELSDALIAAFGDDLGLSGMDSSQLAFLAPAKREALRKINQDYDEMMAKFGAGGVQLASDREKLRLLRLERERDVAALLTPEERLAYEMRTSPSGNSVKARYGDAIESEAEFQKIYALQKAFDESFPRDALTGRISPETMRARADAERQLEANIRAAVGDERYAALRRSADPDLRTIDALANRLNLPPSTTDQVLASRDSYSAESQRISNDTSLAVSQRRAEIQALANKAKSELARTLGGEAADAYAQRSPWMNMLQNGMAYSTTPPDGTPGSFFAGPVQSVYPVLPAGVTPPGAQRQFVINATPPTDAVPGSGAFVSGGNVQVMTFSGGPAGDPTAAPAGARTRVIVTPSDAAGAVPPTPPNANPAPRP